MPESRVIIQFNKLAEENYPYLTQWYLDIPIIISKNRYRELEYLQKLLYKAIHYFISNWHKFESIYSVSIEEKRILDICKAFPYDPGTYRPDFLIDLNNQLKICEIGARFPLNGYFLSGMAEFIGRTKFNYWGSPYSCQYEKFIKYLFNYLGESKDICVLKGIDRPCDIKYYIPYFDSLGIRMHIVSPEELSRKRSLLSHCKVINEFNQEEIENLPDSLIELIAGTNALNDLRSIFLIHNKKFLAVLSDDNFLAGCLTKQEKDFLKVFLIPTYTHRQKHSLWEEARKNKDEWIIKHCRLGKSEHVYAGITCTDIEWNILFDSLSLKDMVLQPLIKTKKITGRIENKEYQDYVVGTLLCCNDTFFGPGIFRTSSHIITNKTDDRKIAPCFVDIPNEHLSSLFIL